MRATVSRAVIGAALLVACGGSGSSGSSLRGYVPPAPKNVGNVSVTEWTPDGAHDFGFVAQPGEVLVVYFGYTNCPDMCPTTMVAVKNAKNRIGDALAARVDLAMVTVDPARDEGENLSRYLGSFADRNHALVPADDAELENAKSAFQVTSTVTERSDGTAEVSHSASAYVVDDTGTVVVEWPFGLDAESMANDLEILLSGKS